MRFSVPLDEGGKTVLQMHDSSDQARGRADQTALSLTSVPFSRVRPAKKSPKRCSAAPSPASRSRGASASSSAWHMRGPNN